MLVDELLKWKFRRGSKEALAQIYEKYLDSMLTLAMGLLNNASEARRLSGTMTQLPQDQREVIVLRLKGDMRFNTGSNGFTWRKHLPPYP